MKKLFNPENKFRITGRLILLICTLFLFSCANKSCPSSALSGNNTDSQKMIGKNGYESQTIPSPQNKEKSRHLFKKQIITKKGEAFLK